jgi:hypothetical protein
VAHETSFYALLPMGYYLLVTTGQATIPAALAAPRSRRHAGTSGSSGVQPCSDQYRLPLSYLWRNNPRVPL